MVNYVINRYQTCYTELFNLWRNIQLAYRALFFHAAAGAQFSEYHLKAGTKPAYLLVDMCG